MDTFVKGENEMQKMPAKERIQTRIVSASAVKRVLDFRFAPPFTWRCSGKKKHPEATTQQSALITNVAKHLWREPQIITFENAFNIWINLWTHTFCNVACRVTLPRVLQTVIYNLNFIVLLHLSSRISQNWFPTASGVLLMVSRIIYVFISINVII